MQEYHEATALLEAGESPISVARAGVLALLGILDTLLRILDAIDGLAGAELAKANHQRADADPDLPRRELRYRLAGLGVREPSLTELTTGGKVTRNQVEAWVTYIKHEEIPAEHRAGYLVQRLRSGEWPPDADEIRRWRYQPEVDEPPPGYNTGYKVESLWAARNRLMGALRELHARYPKEMLDASDTPLGETLMAVYDYLEPSLPVYIRHPAIRELVVDAMVLKLRVHCGDVETDPCD